MNISVEWVADNRGYPFRAECGCGWKSRTYASKPAAQIMADEHAVSGCRT